MFQKVVVAIADCETAQHLWEAALTVAQPEFTTLHLLHVLSPNDENYPQLPIGIAERCIDDREMETYKQQRVAYERDGWELLRSLEELAVSEGIKTESTQVFGEPGRTICRLAETWNADAIAVGRRGRSGLGELLLGSTSNYVVHHAPCSVLVVQP